MTRAMRRQRQWRMNHADPRRMRAACQSEYPKGDKSWEDCEMWCRPAKKPAHCRYCKCRACTACHNGSAPLPEWASGPHARCLRFGECDEWHAQQRQEEAEREAERDLMRAALQADRARERDDFWSQHRQSFKGRGAECNTSADCSSNGACLAAPAAAGMMPEGLPTERREIGADTHLEANGSVWRAASISSHRCVCHAGFSGARCGYASFSQLRAGGASCNATWPCAGERSACVHERCVCGQGWLGARCSFAGFSVLASSHGGAACNMSSDCGGVQNGDVLGGWQQKTGSVCIATPAPSPSDASSRASANTRANAPAAAARIGIGKCRCGAGWVGASCAYSAFASLAVGGGACGGSHECGVARLRARPSAAARPPQPSNGSSSRRGTNASSASDCVGGRCVCAAGWLGEHCDVSADVLLMAARSRARRVEARARSTHLCLSAWRGGDAAEANETIADGTPLVFSLCRRRANRHQLWFQRRATGQQRRGVRIELEGRSQLCVTVPPIFV